MKYLLTCLFPAALLAAQTCPVPPCDLSGQIDGAPYRIVVPQDWNGTLLVFLMGLKGGNNNPSEPQLIPIRDPNLAETLLTRGYALAGSLVAPGAMQAKEEVEDTFALVTSFRVMVAPPRRVILWGVSLGAVATLRFVEDYPRAVDGAIALCTPGAGMARNNDQRLDFLSAYAAVFGWPEEWGALADLRPGLDFARDVNPKVQWPKPDGSNRGAWEFIRLVSGYPGDIFWTADPAMGAAAFGYLMWFATQVRESFEAAAAGPIADNTARVYTLTAAEIGYLRSLGVDAVPLLDKMNGQPKVAANPRSRAFMERYAGVTGSISKPVLSIHTTNDAVVPPGSETALRTAVESAACSGNLLQTYVDGVGHCAFNSAQMLAALDALNQWLDTGVKPNDSVFPLALGFNSTFVPPPYAY